MTAVRRLPLTVWAATAALAGLMVLWALAAPPYRAPDEPQHLSTALRLELGDGYPPPGHARLLPAISASYTTLGFPGGDTKTFVPTTPVRVQPPAAVPSLHALRGATAPPDQAGQADQMTQHPPLWPLLGAAELHLGAADLPADEALLMMRLLQALLVLPVPALAFATGRLLGASRRGAGAATWLLVAVPQVSTVGASITDGDLLLLEWALATPLLVLVARGERRRRVLVALAVVTTAAVLTKVFGLVLLAIAVGAFVVGARGRGRRALLPGLVTVVAVGLAGGWWYVLRAVQGGGLQPSGYPEVVEQQLKMALPAGLAARTFGEQLLTTSVSNPGWLEAASPLWVSGLVTVLVSVPVVVVVVRGRLDRWLAVVATSSFLILLAGTLVRGVQTWRSLHAVYGAQGRYLFPGVVGVLGVLAVALSRGRVARWAPVALPLVAAVSAVVGLRAALRHFWLPTPGSAVGTLRTALGWSPLPEALVLAVAVLGLLAALLAAVVGLRRSGGPASRAAGVPGLSAAS